MLLKTIVLTGASSGIGKATAYNLAHQGWRLILVGRNKNKLSELLNEINDINKGSKSVFVTGDLTSFSEIYKIAEKINNNTDYIDVLLNNAGGIFSKRELSTDGYEKTIVLNHFSIFLLSGLLLNKINLHYNQFQKQMYIACLGTLRRTVCNRNFLSYKENLSLCKMDINFLLLQYYNLFGHIPSLGCQNKF